MRPALLLCLAQTQAWVHHTTTKRLTAAKAAPDGWEDVSGTGACCLRRLTPPNAGKRPPPGAECTVRWTAWLAERQRSWWCRGERIGALQPNSTLDFTLGGGSGEATRAWDACVARMVVGDRVEILSNSDWAFGDGAEPHVPAKAHIVFELELLDVRDWAEGVEVFGADRVDDDDDDVLRKELELAQDKREEGDTAWESAEEKAVLDDLDEKRGGKLDDLLDDVMPTVEKDEYDAKMAALSDKIQDHNDQVEEDPSTFWPQQGSIDGETPQGWPWRETLERMAVDVTLPRAAPSAKAVSVELGTSTLRVSLGADVVVLEALEGPILVGECTWALSEDRTIVEVVLAKRVDGGEAVWARPFLPPGKSPGGESV